MDSFDEMPPPDESGGKRLKRYAQTEFGNTDRLFTLRGKDIRWTPSHGFLSWNGKRWVTDGEKIVDRWCREAIHLIFQDAAQLQAQAAQAQDEEQRKALAAEAEGLSKWARRSETDHMVKAMLSRIQSYPTVFVEPDTFDKTFDARPWLFNFQNGTVDLQTGILRSHRREDYLTMIAPVKYNSEATCPVFEAFVDQIMLGRPELVAYLKKALGYSLTGVTREQLWFIPYGSGSNGKTTLFNAIGEPMGTYRQNMEPETITVSSFGRDGGAPSPDIARLKGARLVIVPETEDGARLATSRIKRLCGEDQMTGRFLHKNPFDFVPTHKLFLYTNHKPHVRENTHAFWRRVRVLPFDFQATEADKDKDLASKLRQEAEGILVWLVQGCLEWQRDGLKSPVEIMRATEAYRNEQDIIQLFVRDECVVREGLQVSASILYSQYKKWAEESMGERAMSLRAFRRLMEEHGYQEHRKNIGAFWLGLCLLSDAPPDDFSRNGYQKAPIPSVPSSNGVGEGAQNGHALNGHTQLHAAPGELPGTPEQLYDLAWTKLLPHHAEMYPVLFPGEPEQRMTGAQLLSCLKKALYHTSPAQNGWARDVIGKLCE